MTRVKMTVVLLRHTEEVSRVSRIAAEATLSGTDFRALRIQLLVHPGGGLLVLLAAMALSVFKPWGMTPYGRRRASQADLPTPNDDARLVRDPVVATSTPRWRFVVGVHAVVLVLLFFVILHLTGGGLRGH